MSARTGLQGWNRHLSRADRSARRSRSFAPSPEGLEGRLLLDGSLDPSFGRAGLVTTQFGGDDTGTAGALQPDGKIVVAGSVAEPGGADTIGVARYLPDGRLDPSFGTAGSGEVLLDPGLQITGVATVAVIDHPGQADDGKILLAGGWNNDTTHKGGVALARLNPDGSLDTSFGSGGAVLDTRVDTRTTNGAESMALQPDGKIVVAGTSRVGVSSRGFVERFNPDGTPDSSFADPGVAAAPVGWTFQGLSALAIDPNRGFFVAGGDGIVIQVAHLTAGGQLDPGFGSGGMATVGAGSGTSSIVSSLAIDPNRGIVVAGSSYGGTPAHDSPAVALLDFQGNLDGSFNGGRVDLVDFPSALDSDASGVAVQPDGKILLAAHYGQTPESVSTAFGLARLNADGTRDSSFGTGGTVITAFPFFLTGPQAFHSAPETVLLQPDGNIVLVGWAGNDFALARYLGSSGVPTSTPQPPVVGAVTTPAPVLVGATATVGASFTYNIPTDRHTAVWNWGDGTTSAGSVSEANGQGSVSGSHVYTAPGIYLVTLTVTDQRGASGSATAVPGVVVISTVAGAIGGGGVLSGPPLMVAAATPAGQVRFRLSAKYAGNRAVPQGQTVLQFKAAHRTFRSTGLDWLVISGDTAWYEGSGTINGAGSYGFLVSASGGGSGAAKVRIRVWDKANGAVVYDSQPGAPIGAAPTSPIVHGHIALRVGHGHRRASGQPTPGASR